MRFQRQQLNFLAFLSLVVFTLFGGLIHLYLLPYSLMESLSQGANFTTQIVVGTSYGLIASFFSWQLIQSKLLKDIRKFFFKLLKPLEFRLRDILLVSLCAGIGEEILFRASIQPLLGIWLTALIFVMLHGYISYKSPQLSIYGFYMVVVAAGFGYLTKHVGLVSAIAAHSVIDIALLVLISKTTCPSENQDEIEDQTTGFSELSNEEQH